MIQIDLENYSVPLGRAGKFGHIDADCEKFPEAVQVHIYKYGLRQILNDAMADKKDENGNIVPVNELVAMAQKRHENLLKGELRARREGEAEIFDPIKSEAFKLLRAKLHEQYLAANLYKIVPKGTKDRTLFVLNHGLKAKKLPTFEDAQSAWETILSKETPLAKSIWAAAEKIVNEKEKVVNLDELGL